MSFFSELHRRNVFRVGAAYVVTAWLLIEVAETIFPLFGFDETPARIVVVVLAIGLVPTLVLAWAFEWTPEGLKRDADVDRSLPVAVDKARRLDRVIMVVLALALGVFAFDKFVLDPARDAGIVESARQEGRADAIVEAYGERSIAVLPFVNMSADPEQEYFSDGMAEELLNLLARIPDLRVISRSSAFTYKDKDVPIPTIAAELGVNYIVEGSVRKGGDTVRITAQLIEARPDRHLWSETYDRQLKDVFAIQDEISAAIVGELEVALGKSIPNSPKTRGTTGTEAHEAYLRGQYLFAQRTPESMAAAVEEFTKAVARDPEYAPGQAGLALATRFLSETQYGDLPKMEALARARPHAERALELDPDLPEAHTAMAYVLLTNDTLDQAMVHFQRAVELNPNYAEATMWLGGFLEDQGNYEESFALLERAVQIDPLSIPAIANYFQALVARGRQSEAERQLEKLATLAPAAHRHLWVHLQSLGGDWAAAVLAALQAELEHPLGTVVDSNLRVLLAAMGLDEDALAVTRNDLLTTLELLGRPDEIVLELQRRQELRPLDDNEEWELPYAFAALGEFDNARPLLEDQWRFINGVVDVPWFGANSVLALRAARREAGEVADHEELVAALQDSVRRYQRAGIVRCDVLVCIDYEKGVAAYLAGDRESGLESLARAVERGGFILPNQAYLQFLYEDPGFEPILEAQRAHQRAEREQFLRAVCPDNPYANVWRPVEGTCDGYNYTD